jgi:hypothetical protein
MAQENDAPAVSEEIPRESPSLLARLVHKLKHMNTSCEATSREHEVEQILADRNPLLIRQGVQAYKDRLDELLAQNLYRHLVAFRGAELVAVAPTQRKLDAALRRQGHLRRSELFITLVAPLDLDEE